MADTGAIIELEGLDVAFGGRDTRLHALREVGFTIRRGSTMALVGESGSGKSVTSLALMGLLGGNAEVSARTMRFRPSRQDAPIDLMRLDRAAWRSVRGRHMAMIFQEPMSSLNPLYPIGDQIGEALLLHSGLDAASRKRRVVELLELVEIPAARERLGAWPHELSGGMRQRVMIAMALACDPGLLIADEPTTALDVTIQAQILDLMRRLQAELSMSILFITHDLGVVAEVADDVAVMYAGQIVEQTTKDRIFKSPSHPYTRALLRSMPRSGMAANSRLQPIPGTVPALHAMPRGCGFAPRCGFAIEACRAGPVALAGRARGHLARCVRSERELAHG